MLNRKKNFKNEDSLTDHWENVKHTNIHIVRVPEEKERNQQRTYLKKE